jgi:SAM-dependent methyltransferase
MCSAAAPHAKSITAMNTLRIGIEAPILARATIVPMSGSTLGDTTYRQVRRRTYGGAFLTADWLIVRHVRQFVISRMRAYLRSGMRVLDAGCGEQPFRSWIESHGAHYVGNDIVQNAAATVDLVAPITAIPAESASFDLVLVSEVLEHVADSAGAFAELARLLRPGGQIIITTPFMYRLHEEPHDYVRLTNGAIAAHATHCGLAVAESATLGNELEVIAVTWMNLFAAVAEPWSPPLRMLFTAARLPLNAATNMVAWICSGLTPRLPRKSYLTTASVLERPRSA